MLFIGLLGEADKVIVGLAALLGLVFFGLNALVVKLVPVGQPSQFVLVDPVLLLFELLPEEVLLVVVEPVVLRYELAGLVGRLDHREVDSFESFRPG